MSAWRACFRHKVPNIAFGDFARTSETSNIIALKLRSNTLVNFTTNRQPCIFTKTYVRYSRSQFCTPESTHHTPLPPPAYLPSSSPISYWSSTFSCLKTVMMMGASYSPGFPNQRPRFQQPISVNLLTVYGGPLSCLLWRREQRHGRYTLNSVKMWLQQHKAHKST